MFSWLHKYNSSVSSRLSRFQLLAVALFAACNMLYYLLYNRVLASLTGDLVLWSSIGSGVYLCALGCGILSAQRAPEDPDELQRSIARIELSLALLAPLSLILLYLAHMLYRIYIYDFGQLQDEPWPRSVYFGAFAQLPLAGLGWLAGREAGCINKLEARRGLRGVQILLFAYYGGGLLGTAALLLGLAPRFEPLPIALTAAALNLLALLPWLGFSRFALVRFWALPSALLMLLGWGVHASRLAAVQRQNFYYNQYSWKMSGDGQMSFRFPRGLLDWWRVATHYPEVERHQGPYQLIDFVPSPSQKDAWVMTMDGRFQVSSEHEADYHRTLAHFPSLLAGRSPARVLIIGGGDGLLVRSLLANPEPPEAITLVDIDPKIIELARSHPQLTAANQHALADPRVTVVVADAFQYLRQQRASFDRIYLDVLFPYNFESSRLFSVEFFGVALRHLQEEGALVMLSPLDFDAAEELSSDESAQLGLSLQSTLSAVGCREQVLFAEPRHNFLACFRQTPPGARDPLGSALYRKYFGAGAAEPRFRRLPAVYAPYAVNSVLKPQFFGQRDTFF